MGIASMIASSFSRSRLLRRWGRFFFSFWEKSLPSCNSLFYPLRCSAGVYLSLGRFLALFNVSYYGFDICYFLISRKTNLSKFSCHHWVLGKDYIRQLF